MILLIYSSQIEAQNQSYLDSITSEINKLGNISEISNRNSISSNIIESLHLNQYPFAKIDTTNLQIEIGPKIKLIQAIACDENTELLLNRKKLIEAKNLNEFKKKLAILKKEVAANGLPFELITTKKIDLDKEILYLYICIESKNKRTIDQIITKGYQNIPENLIKRRLNRRLRKGKNINISNELIFIEQMLPMQFTTSPKYLYKKDSTKLFLYTEKNSANQFSGILGFSNEENSFKLNGDARLKLENIINLNEQINIQYNNTNSNQEIISLNLGLPFIFNTAISTQTDFRIFNQDSTFSNTVFNQGVFYSINQELKMGLNYNSETSSGIAETSGNFEYNGIGLKTVFSTKKYGNFNLSLETGVRKTEIETTRSKIEAGYNKTIQVSSLYSTSIKTNYAKLISKSYFEGELYRIGGINDLRGFLEYSIAATEFGTLQIDHNFDLTKELKTLIISDFGFSKNQQNTIKTQNWYSFGFGLELLQNDNKIRLIIANGFSSAALLDAQDTKVHISISSYF